MPNYPTKIWLVFFVLSCLLKLTQDNYEEFFIFLPRYHRNRWTILVERFFILSLWKNIFEIIPLDIFKCGVATEQGKMAECKIFLAQQFHCKLDLILPPGISWKCPKQGNLYVEMSTKVTCTLLWKRNATSPQISQTKLQAYSRLIRRKLLRNKEFIFTRLTLFWSHSKYKYIWRNGIQEIFAMRSYKWFLYQNFKTVPVTNGTSLSFQDLSEDLQ